jgi:hypothetical protein
MTESSVAARLATNFFNSWTAPHLLFCLCFGPESELRSDFYSDFDLLKLVKFPITC